ncbi:hypothetical protein J1605_000549 [Eschrichtius robustus]|uniref:ATP-binding cassette sub-family C member 11 n=1 Tax=Eschrichtius robustus TaxID=9764 RepID=A0AB34GV93_ESCRO|nr:hypothetical protein J1605_000549 [Eschrichtius robustus]
MTRKKIYWVPRSSGDLVNLSLDVDDDTVSGLSYKTFTLEDSPWSQQVREPEAPEMGKYDAARRTVIPFRPKPKFPAPQPPDDAGLFSYLTLSWFSPVTIQGLRKRLDENTIPQLSVHDASAKNAKRLHLLWEEEDSRHGTDKASVLRVMLRFQRTRVIFNTLLGSCFSAASVLGPMLVIPKILEYTEEQLGNIAYGAISFFTSDINCLFEGVCYGPLALLTCLLLIACSITSCLTLGPTALIAVLCYLLILQLEIFLARKVVKIQNHASEVSDQYIRMTSEVLTCIKLIKMYTWEKSFSKIIKDLRRKEVELLEKCGFIWSLTTATLFTASSMASVVTFLIHTGLRLKLTASVAFTTVATLNPMRLSVVLVPFTVKGLAMSRSASERFKKIFLQESPVIYVKALKDPSKTVVWGEATLSWRKTCPGIVNGALELERNGHTPEGMTRAQPPLGALRPEDKGDTRAPELHKINRVVSKGTMLGVCGNTGNGKSSLLSAILGEEDQGLPVSSSTSLDHGGSIWGNILTGSQYDKARILGVDLLETRTWKSYLQGLHCGSLNHDLEILPFRGTMEIGERGLNLSGGQKQRISLAQAVYSDRELYLLDNPLSAVDTHVGKHTFEECINKVLRGKTVILVTHQLQTNSSQESNRTTADPGDILDNPQLPFYQLVYGLSALFTVCMGICPSAAFTKVVRKAPTPTALHNKLFNRVSRCPMCFFDTTPTGRLLNCFAGDLHELDQFLPTVAEQSLLLILVVTTILMIVSVASPSVLLTGVVTLIVCLVYFRMFKRAINAFKSLENYSSPLLSPILTTLHGLSSIHVYGETEDSISKFKRLTVAQNNYLLRFLSSTRWVALKLELMTNMVTLMVALFTFFGVSSAPYSYKAMAISLVLQRASNFQACVRISSETEAYFTAVERMLQYMKMCVSEAALHIEGTNCPHGWPQHGEITFQDYQMKYRDNTPLVLYGLNLTIHGQEVVGIVGRTGSGKSSLGEALFRLVEPATGRILIDGVDICSLGLEHLRSKFSVIPQDPVLLSGTIRFNLDPFDHRTDEQIWDALERTSLSEVRRLPSPPFRIHHIILIDEATASIDLETDTLIQSTICEGIRGCTALIVAHRVTTILNCDRILVMRNGKVVEFDRPEVLQKKPGSMFAALHCELAAASSSLSLGEGRLQ